MLSAAESGGKTRTLRRPVGADQLDHPADLISHDPHSCVTQGSKHCLSMGVVAENSCDSSVHE